MKPTDTTKEAKEMPMLMLAQMMGGVGAGIEAQEKQGQAELVSSTVLPTQGIENVRSMIESNGGSIGDVADDLFTNVTLPAGWDKKGSDHAMHSGLVDNLGRKRAGIFYKAAFYDRAAHISACRRFSIDRYSHNTEGEARVFLVDALGEVEFSTEVVKFDESRSRYSVLDELEKVAFDFMHENYPEWNLADAYWD